MLRRTPDYDYRELPCSHVVLHLANEYYKINDLKLTTVDNHGYCTLSELNTTVKANFKVKKYEYYNRKDRKLLREFSRFGCRAIVCVLGHYIYVDDATYYSFFNNDNDPVIAIWYLEE